jgi:hypothetical protein
MLWLLFIVLFLLSLGNAFLFGYLYEKAHHIEERPPSSRIIGYGDSHDLNTFDIRPYYEKHN